MRRNADRACSLIGNYLSQYKMTADAEFVDRIIDVQWHGRIPVQFMNPPPRYYGSNYALKVIGKNDLDLLTETLKKRLRRNVKEVRINTGACHPVFA